MMAVTDSVSPFSCSVKVRSCLTQAGNPAPSDAARSMYVNVENVRDVSRRLEGQVEVVEAVHETFYVMREFVVRDLNGFWITFGQPLPH